MDKVGRLFLTGHKEAIVCAWELGGTSLILSPVDSVHGPITLDLSRADLSLGGFNQAQIVLKDGDLTFYATRESLEKPLRSLHLERLQRALGLEHVRVRHSLRMSWVGLAVVLVCAALAGVLVWWVSDRLVERAAAMTPLSWDVELGKAAWKAQSLSLRELKDTRITEPVRQIVERLGQPYRGQGFEFDVHVVDDPQVNAYAMPGGQIAVYSGLLTQAEGPEEVAGVLAHEIQHVVGRHGVRGIYAQLRWQLALAVLVGDSSSVHSQLMSSGAFFAGLSYDRSMESEADRQGMELLQQIGFPQAGMLKFFRKMDQEQGKLEQNLKYLSTHPTSAERIAALEKWVTPASQGATIPVDWKSLREALGKGLEDASRGRQ